MYFFPLEKSGELNLSELGPGEKILPILSVLRRNYKLDYSAFFSGGAKIIERIDGHACITTLQALMQLKSRHREVNSSPHSAPHNVEPTTKPFGFGKVEL